MLVKCGRPPPARPIQSSNSIMSNAFRSSPFFWQRPFPFRIVFMRFIAIFAAAAVVVVVIAVVVVVIAVVVVVGGGGGAAVVVGAAVGDGSGVGWNCG